ncbi:MULTISPECIES: type VII secretion-associated protein [unclassified Corynebacterium]|uniref:type VII secretion-associated protein n=1 Tax=unclassified Corynebacterium TaxID=2624378 RepID=UPI0029CA0F95|nr:MULTISPECIES: type VII secretion-associated protein [unclassified Corynebacterium]WPF66522.1 type VII secretion-associated protein [Corynebacterium sp. 22KM0430]WPF69011.1 type VII secretion-associated protein [Corynebacterium sp. 21KM1197]
MSSLVITILEEATVFEGADTVYRYDLVPPVLTEPWALTAVVEQAQAVLPEDGEPVEVRVTMELAPDAPDAPGREEAGLAVEAVQAALRAGLPTALPEAVQEVGLGVREGEPVVEPGDVGDSGDAGYAERPEPTEILYPSLPSRTSPVNGSSASGRDALALMKGRTGKHTRGGDEPLWRRFTWIHLAMVGIIAAVVGLSWWTMGRSTTLGTEPKAQGIVGSPVPVAAEESEGAAASPQGPASSSPPIVVHEIGRVRASTTAGFRGDMEGEDVVFRGEDEALRIRVSADPVFGVPAEAVLREVMETVEHDPTLSGVEPGAPPQGEKEKVRYREEPGDGSVVEWVTWVEAGHHVSVGCHTREASTVVQRAACRIVEESTGVL